MYFNCGICGSYVAGCKGFSTLSSRNLYSYNGLFCGYAELGQMKPAKKLFDIMVERDVALSGIR